MYNNCQQDCSDCENKKDVIQLVNKRAFMPRYCDGCNKVIKFEENMYWLEECELHFCKNCTRIPREIFKYKALHEDVYRIVEKLDPECPDAEAYIDGHCSLYELVSPSFSVVEAKPCSVCDKETDDYYYLTKTSEFRVCKHCIEIKRQE